MFGDYQFNGYTVKYSIVYENNLLCWGEQNKGFSGSIFGTYELDSEQDWVVDHHQLLKTGHVYDMAVNDTTVYIGGIFYKAGTLIVNNIVEVKIKIVIYSFFIILMLFFSKFKMFIVVICFFWIKTYIVNLCKGMVKNFWLLELG